MGQLPTRTDPASIAELPSTPNVVVLMFVYSTAKVSHISYTCTVNLCTFSVCEMTSLFCFFFARDDATSDPQDLVVPF